jgi:hypothetical protein
MKPNLFQIATKELSQDAFFTWLLKWADASNAQYDKDLHECAQDFVKYLIEVGEIKSGNIHIEKVEVKRQRENIDIWAEINDQILIIIEDKTHTKEHSNQLERYRHAAASYSAKNGHQLICIYLKTGDESQNSLQPVQEKGFAVVDRPQILKVLRSHKHIKNDIFDDFVARMETVEEEVRSFKSRKIGSWSSASWKGFYQFLEKEKSIKKWYKVNNQNGGFWNAILCLERWNNFIVYLQIEEGDLCFKINMDPDGNGVVMTSAQRRSIRNQWHRMLMEAANKQSIQGIERPERFGNGQYMTTAVVKKSEWLGSEEEVMQPEKVVANLKKYKLFLQKTVGSVSKVDF